MPAGLVNHLRYPEDLFRVQTAAYARYQLDPSQFFERTGAWSVAQGPPTAPNEKALEGDTTPVTQPEQSPTQSEVESSSARFVPYYTMFHPPAATDGSSTFSILRPYVPYSKNAERTELQSFMVASSDPQSYGQLTAYVLTNNNVDGPAVVANNAESEAEISRQISLLNSQGSQVRFGDLQLVPIAGGLLYLRPFYVLVDKQAEYHKIIVSYNAQAVIDDTIGGALRQLFRGFQGDVGDRVGGGTATPDTSTDGTSNTGTSEPNTDATPEELLQQAQQLFDDADAALKDSPPDYATYGEKQQQARDLIQQAINLLQSGG